MDFPAFRRWLVPGTALFAALFTFNAQTSRPDIHWLNSSPTGLVASLELAEPHMASYASLEHSDHNLIPLTAAVFDWTNGSHSLTTTLPILDKNSLSQ